MPARPAPTAAYPGPCRRHPTRRDELLDALLRHGPLCAEHLGALLGVDRPALCRLLAPLLARPRPCVCELGALVRAEDQLRFGGGRWLLATARAEALRDRPAAPVFAPPSGARRLGNRAHQARRCPTEWGARLPGTHLWAARFVDELLAFLRDNHGPATVRPAHQLRSEEGWTEDPAALAANGSGGMLTLLPTAAYEFDGGKSRLGLHLGPPFGPPLGDLSPGLTDAMRSGAAGVQWPRLFVVGDQKRARNSTENWSAPGPT